MNITNKSYLYFFFITFLLSSCGGGSNSPTVESRTVAGEVLAPNGVIAKIDQNNPMSVAIIDFVFSSAKAAITGLSGVPNATVNLIRIDNNGDQVGAIIATGTADNTGTFTLELPEGVQPSGDLVIEVGGSGTSIRAVVFGNDVDVSPVSEFILQTLIDGGIKLASLETVEIASIIEAVEQLDIAFVNETLEQSLATIENSVVADGELSTAIDTLIASAEPVFVGNWTSTATVGDCVETNHLTIRNDGTIEVEGIEECTVNDDYYFKGTGTWEQRGGEVYVVFLTSTDLEDPIGVEFVLDIMVNSSDELVKPEEEGTIVYTRVEE